VPPVSAVEEVPSGGAWTLARLQEAWPALMEKLQGASLNLASSARDAELAAFENGLLSLKVANPFQRKVLEDAAERGRLEAALSGLCGQAVKVQLSFVEAPRKKGPGAKPSAEEVEKLLKGSPELRKVQELFGAEIIEIRNE
jgi:hypothetical protein